MTPESNPAAFFELQQHPVTLGAGEGRGRADALEACVDGVVFLCDLHFNLHALGHGWRFHLLD